MHCIVCIPSMIRSGSTVVMVVAFEVAGAGGAGETEALYSSGNSLMLAASDACLDRAGDDDAGAVVVEHCIFQKANCISELRVTLGG